MSVFLTSDWHLGDTRLDLLGRPFTSPEEMLQSLVREHNLIVSSDDELLFLGDICVSKDQLPNVAHFQGHKTLIRGNKDRIFSDEELEPYFEHIVPEGEGIELELPNLPIFAGHYPTLSRPDRFNLVGHIHTSWRVQLNMLNVGVDVHHFRPIPLEGVPFFLKAISTYYDEDVWVANHPANIPFRSRGRKGSYFPPKD